VSGLAGRTDERFRLGLIGAGRMGRTHLRAIAPSNLVAVTAIVEPSVAAREAAAGNGRRMFATVEEMVDASDIDGVLIAAPSDRHAEIVERLAAARLPILCEKPCGLTPAEVARAARAAEADHVPLQVAYWRRFVPALQQLHDRIASGELGDVHFVACLQWDGAPPAASFRAHSGGIFIDMGVHEFDQLRWLTGQDIGNLSAIASPLVADRGVMSDVDSGQVLLAMSGGATGLVSLGRWFPVGDMARVEAFGTRDAVRIDFLDPAEGEGVQLDALRRQAEAFADYARGGRPTGASVEDAARALEAAFEATGHVPRLAGAATASAATLGGHA
jgi:myo-inositol 2-dehydrogenase / D-chiro-inositol 1-dehydrogenase